MEEEGESVPASRWGGFKSSARKTEKKRSLFNNPMLPRFHEGSFQLLPPSHSSASLPHVPLLGPCQVPGNAGLQGTNSERTEIDVKKERKKKIK